MAGRLKLMDGRLEAEEEKWDFYKSSRWLQKKSQRQVNAVCEICVSQDHYSLDNLTFSQNSKHISETFFGEISEALSWLPKTVTRNTT